MKKIITAIVLAVASMSAQADSKAEFCKRIPDFAIQYLEELSFLSATNPGRLKDYQWRKQVYDQMMLQEVKSFDEGPRWNNVERERLFQYLQNYRSYLAGHAVIFMDKSSSEVIKNVASKCTGLVVKS
jgi:hypothetical protein